MSGAFDLILAMRELREQFDLDVVACTRRLDGAEDDITVRVTRSGPVEIENAEGWLLTSEEP